MILPSHHQPSKIAPPCQGALDLPSSLVAAPGASILGGWFLPIFPLRANQLNASSCPSGAQRIGIGGLVIDQAGRIFPRSAPAGARHSNLLQGRFNQPDFVRGRRVQVGSQRKTLAVCHPHPLRTPCFRRGRLFPRLVGPTQAPLFWPGQNYHRPTSPPSRVGLVYPVGPTTSATPLARCPALPNGVLDASTYSARGIARAGLATAHHCLTPTKYPQTPNGWQSVGDRLWATLSVGVTTALYAPIGHRSIQTYGAT